MKAEEMREITTKARQTLETELPRLKAEHRQAEDRAREQGAAKASFVLEQIRAEILAMAQAGLTRLQFCWPHKDKAHGAAYLESLSVNVVRSLIEDGYLCLRTVTRCMTSGEKEYAHDELIFCVEWGLAAKR